MRLPVWLVATSLACGGPDTNAETCDELEETWTSDFAAWADAHDDCDRDEDCAGFYGPCPSGLGGCSIALQASVTQAEVSGWDDDARDAYDAEGCGIGNLCDCYALSEAYCDAGTCATGAPTSD